MIPDKEFVFGVNPVLEKLRAAPHQILEVLISDHSSRAVLRLIARDAARLGLRVVNVPPHVLDRLARGQRHQGVIAKVADYHYSSVDLLFEQVSGKVSSEWILILDGLTDPRNFGALLRTAEAVGVHHVVIPKHRSVDVTPVVVKASSGATDHLNIVKATNLRRVMTELKTRGYWIIGLDARGQQSIYNEIYPAQVAIVLGNEGKGIRQINLQECDFVVSIPMLGRIESLNVSVAGAIFLYELLRQSRGATKA